MLIFRNDRRFSIYFPERSCILAMHNKKCIDRYGANFKKKNFSSLLLCSCTDTCFITYDTDRHLKSACTLGLAALEALYLPCKWLKLAFWKMMPCGEEVIFPADSQWWNMWDACEASLNYSPSSWPTGQPESWLHTF